ncbi:MAG: hypothetical protein GY832_20045 [Chloroflexi bacterium]|nr:hypothetical protein [Chloroflexota bacterium]
MKKHELALALLFLSVVCIAFFAACIIYYKATYERTHPAPDICAPEWFDGRVQGDWASITSPIIGNVELVEYRGRPVKSVLVRGSNAYVRTGPSDYAHWHSISEMVTVFDISDPAHPTRKERLLLPGELLDVDPDVKLAYILRENDLWEVDISNPDALTGIHLYDIPGEIEDIHIADKKVYVSLAGCRQYSHMIVSFSTNQCTSGVHVIDISTPTFNAAPTDCYQGADVEQVARYVRSERPFEKEAENIILVVTH